MSPRLKAEPAIARLALDLGIAKGGNPKDEIVEFCRKRVIGFQKEFGSATLDGLLEGAAARLDVLFIELHSDQELLRVRTEYTAKGEAAFANLEAELNGKTLAITFRLMHADSRERKFVAVIDCRGSRRYKAYFSKWHEIAHLLTLTSQLQLKFCRTHVSDEPKDPEESLMDVIAGHVGFLPEVVAPHAYGRASFAKLLDLRAKLAPTASVQAATMNLVASWPRPTILMRAGLGFKKAEISMAPSFDFVEAPVAILRAIQSTSNPAARLSGLVIHPNMRVPKGSVIQRVFAGDVLSARAFENLNWWSSKDRGNLASVQIEVEAVKQGNGVDILITAM